MPQFDTLSFFSQISWVFLMFGIAYLVVSFFISPTVSSILKLRNIWSDSNTGVDAGVSFSNVFTEGVGLIIPVLDESKKIPTTLNFLLTTNISVMTNVFREDSSLKPFVSSIFFFGFFRTHLF